MPEEKIKQYEDRFLLSIYDATQLTDEKLLSKLFDEVALTTTHWKLLANFFLGPVRSHLNQHSLDWNQLDINKMHWDTLLKMVDEGKIAFSAAAQSILPVMFDDVTTDPHEVAVKLNLIQDAGEDEVVDWVKKTLDAMPDKVAEYKKGKMQLGVFMTDGYANLNLPIPKFKKEFVWVILDNPLFVPPFGNLVVHISPKQMK